MTDNVGRESYALAAEGLASATARATDLQRTTVADEILLVTLLLRREPRLRRALTDPSRPGADRAALLRTLLAGKVSETTVNVLTGLAQGRWSRPADLLDATERLGVDAVLSAAQASGTIADVEDELFRFGQIVSGNPQLAVTLGDPAAPAVQRVKLVKDLLDGKAQAATLRLVEVALEGFGGRGFEFSLTRLVELAAAKRDREVAYVTVAKPRSDADEQRLSDKLSELYGRQVSLKVDVNPHVIGGVSVRIGSDLYDGTILRRLNDAKQAFAK